MAVKTSAQILHYLNPNQQRTPMVVAAAASEQRRTGKTFGNAEQKIGAYIDRIDKIQSNPALAARLAKLAIQNNVTPYNAISEHHWEMLFKQAYNEGIACDDSEQAKHAIVDRVQDLQRETLEPWFDHFSELGDFYEPWFSLYALQHIVKMGVFDVENGNFHRRSRRATAPYPPLNYDALHCTYNAYSAIYGNNEKGVADDVVLRSVDGGFNAVYSHYVLETAQPVDVPENAADVKGEWRFYTKDDAATIARSAEGTNWCIATQNVARAYAERLDSGFHLFYLQDPTESYYSKRAALSVRMNRGKVAELSGTQPMQDIDDALLDTMFEKVLSLPGGEDYYFAMQAKQHLVEMDEKLQADQPFSYDDVLFLYEVNQPIAQLSSHYDDVRIDKFKISRKEENTKILAAELGEQAARIFVAEPRDLLVDYKEYIMADMPVRPFIKAVTKTYAGSMLDTMLGDMVEVGVNPNSIVSAFDDGKLSVGIVEKLASAGSILEPVQLMAKVGTLSTYGHGIPALLGAGVPPELIMKYCPEASSAANLIRSGIPAIYVYDKLTYREVNANLPGLVRDGAPIDVDMLLLHLRPRQIASQLPMLLALGAVIDAEAVIKALSGEEKIIYLAQLRDAGVTIDVQYVIGGIKPKRRELMRQWLVLAGEDPTKYLDEPLRKGEMRQKRRIHTPKQ